MTDPIQHPRETVHITIDGTVTIREDATDEDLCKVIRSMRDYPALLAVAEAARNPEIGHSERCSANCGPVGEGWIEDEMCDCGVKELRIALAKLDEGK